MSAFSDQLDTRVESLLSTSWSETDGRVVPTTDTVALKDGAVKLDAVFLYADLAGSSQLAKICPWETTAKIIRAYLACATSIIRQNGGEIRSFDGDRVMGVFIGDRKNSNAVKSARQIDWAVEKVLAPKATAKFKSIKENDLKIRHAVGVDWGTSRAVRAGIRNSNDLIWIGAAPSFAAKLSDIREYPYTVIISKEVYKKMSDDLKVSGETNVWEEATYLGRAVYKTKYMLAP